MPDVSILMFVAFTVILVLFVSECEPKGRKPAGVLACLLVICFFVLREVIELKKLEAWELDGLILFCEVGLAISVFPHWFPRKHVICEESHVDLTDSIADVNLAAFEDRKEDD